MTEDRLVTFRRFFDPIEAHIVAGRLEASGIPVHLLGVHHASANTLAVVALGGVQLQVPLPWSNKQRRCSGCGHEWIDEA